MSATLTRAARQGGGFVAGGLIGALGGLIGLGGAEFRLPVLKGVFRLATLEAVIFNKAMSLLVVAVALLSRSGSIPWGEVWAHGAIVANLLAGSLLGAWFAAGKAIRLPERVLNTTIMLLLVGLALLLIAEQFFHLVPSGRALFLDPLLQVVAGVAAGVFIGMVAALLGVAGGELLIPTIVLLWGADIKLAGSLSLAVSLPTMVVGFMRYRGAAAFEVLGRERPLFLFMAAGSLVGAVIGGVALGWVPTDLLIVALALILLVSAVKVFKH
ncbi:MAG: sulfite exporter TauE/SafE family protein [Halothiobacillaceae bacterium]